MAGNKRGDHTSINTEDAYKRSMDSFKEKVINVPTTYPGGCIYRIPKNLLKLNENAYTPQIVSIGPFHHDNQNLKAMENHKLQYMRDLFRRISEPRTIFEACSEDIWRLKEIIGNSYVETIDFKSNAFLEMMLLDGCFILELLLKRSDQRRDENDPLFKQLWMVNAVQRDLLLFENQIPFTILESLYDRLAVTSTDSLVKLSLRFFGLTFSIECERLSHKHLLDLLRNSYLLSSTEKEPSERTWNTIPCATDLNRAGIDFKKCTNGKLFDASFMNGVLRISPLTIQDRTESSFRNLIALEQYCYVSEHYITSYAMVMDFLINSTQDVELLQRKGIITNHLGDEKAISVLFNNLCKEITVGRFHFTKLFEKVNNYYQNPCHEWKAILKRNYFNNPWTIISFIGAIILLILTIAQTVFSVLSYYFPNKSWIL